MNRDQLKYLPLGAGTFGILVSFVALLGIQPAHAASSANKSAIKRVAIFQYADTPLHERGARGMIEGLESKGFVDGKNLELTSHNALRNTETARDIAQEIAKGAFDRSPRHNSRSGNRSRQVPDRRAESACFAVAVGIDCGIVGVNSLDDKPRRQP